MGFRLVLRRLEYPSAVKAGQMMQVHMWWLNAGVAPIYRQFALTLQLQSAAETRTVPLTTDLTKLLPGDAVVDQLVYVPDSLKPGTYRVRLAVLDPRTNQAAVRLAIKGREADGWYNLGAITVE
jgi:hypothetical protein